MTRKRLSKARHLAVIVVLSNLVLIGLLGSMLSGTALAVLPVFAILLPLLSAAAIEAALSHTGLEKPATARVRLGRAQHHAV